MDYLVSHPLIPFISFTGSVANGKRVEKTAALAAENGAGFKMVGLELGGKDAAYVREGAFARACRCSLSALLKHADGLAVFVALMYRLRSRLRR